uniref:Uncharacterized protein n=1 Tax=Romanomermis culicivorax TaxID=13658 RepID=A0A915J686_ROMCU
MLNGIPKDGVAVLIMDYSSSKALQSIILTFNNVSIYVQAKVESKVGRWVNFVVKFNLMKCIWRAILKLLVLATPIMAPADPKEDIQHPEVPGIPHHEQGRYHPLALTE